MNENLAKLFDFANFDTILQFLFHLGLALLILFFIIWILVKKVPWKIVLDKLGILMSVSIMKTVDGNNEILKSSIKDINTTLSNLKQEITKNKDEYDFKIDSGRADFTRFQIKSIVKKMRANEYFPNDPELAKEYYDMCLWYDAFCEKHKDPNNHLYYENSKMNLSSAYYKKWYEDNWK